MGCVLLRCMSCCGVWRLAGVCLAVVLYGRRNLTKNPSLKLSGKTEASEAAFQAWRAARSPRLPELRRADLEAQQAGSTAGKASLTNRKVLNRMNASHMPPPRGSVVKNPNANLHCCYEAHFGVLCAGSRRVQLPVTESVTSRSEPTWPQILGIRV